MGAAGGAKRRRQEPGAVYTVTLVQPPATRLEEWRCGQARQQLWLLVGSGDADGLRGFLEKHGDNAAVVDSSSPSAPPPPAVDGDTALCYACRAGHKEVVSLLLRAKAVDVNHVNELSREGGTPLTICCENGAAALVALLLADGRVDVNAPRADGCTALFMASQNGHTDVVRMLLAAPGIDVDLPEHCNRFTPLVIAVWKGRHAAALALLAASADVNARTARDHSALLIAVDRRDPVLHAALLKHGADASLVHSALFRACLMGTALQVRDCVERTGLDEDAGLTPLHVACLLGDEAKLQAALREPGAASRPDASGLGALYYAVELGEMHHACALMAALGVPEAVTAKAAHVIPELVPRRTLLRLPTSDEGQPGQPAATASEELWRPGTAPAAQSRKPQADGSAFFKAVVLPFVEEGIYVDCSGAKDLLLAYLGSVAAARFLMRDERAFGRLQRLCLLKLRGIEERLEGVFVDQRLGEKLATLGSGLERGCRQDDAGLLPTFPMTHGYGPSATFYEDDYIDALLMLSIAVDAAFFRKVEGALGGVECSLRHPKVKSRTRMRNKLGDPEDHLGKERPRPAHNVDTVRCAATFADANSLTRGYNALVRAFGAPVRVKNGFGEHFEASKSFGYRSVIMNLRFDTSLTFQELFGTERARSLWERMATNQPSRETGLAMQRVLKEWFRSEAVRPSNVAMAAEVQLILKPYLQARKESHLLYKVARCGGAAALVSDAAGSALAGRHHENSLLEEATRELQGYVLALIEERARKVESVISCSTIDIEDVGDEGSFREDYGLADIMRDLPSFAAAR